MTEQKKENDYKKTLKSLSKNYWAISTIVLAILLVVTLYTGGNQESVVTAKVAGQNVLSFAEQQGADAGLVSVNDEGSLYAVTLEIEGQKIPVYVTKDGENLITNLIPLTTQPTQNRQNQQQQTVTSYSEEDLVKIKEFSQCLADNGVKAYGAAWCGYCKKLKDAFGGAEQIEPFYLECQNADKTPTQYAELCQQEQITGFPTIKINGEPYRGARTIQGLASAVDACDAPELEGSTQTTQQQAQQEATPYTEEDLTKLKTFNDCLGEKGVKVYGANWCGWTKKWTTDTLGGPEATSAIYVECTENEELCSSEGITGYPTTKINGEIYTGARTVEAIAEATGCTAPTLTGSAPVAANNAAAGCGA